jgi:hypothetical protein
MFLTKKTMNTKRKHQLIPGIGTAAILGVMSFVGLTVCLRYDTQHNDTLRDNNQHEKKEQVTLSMVILHNDTPHNKKLQRQSS